MNTQGIINEITTWNLSSATTEKTLSEQNYLISNTLIKTDWNLIKELGSLMDLLTYQKSEYSDMMFIFTKNIDNFSKRISLMLPELTVKINEERFKSNIKDPKNYKVIIGIIKEKLGFLEKLNLDNIYNIGLNERYIDSEKNYEILSEVIEYDLKKHINEVIYWWVSMPSWEDRGDKYFSNELSDLILNKSDITWIEINDYFSEWIEDLSLDDDKKILKNILDWNIFLNSFKKNISEYKEKIIEYFNNNKDGFLLLIPEYIKNLNESFDKKFIESVKANINWDTENYKFTLEFELDKKYRSIYDFIDEINISSAEIIKETGYKLFTVIKNNKNKISNWKESLIFIINIEKTKELNVYYYLN